MDFYIAPSVAQYLHETLGSPFATALWVAVGIMVALALLGAASRRLNRWVSSPATSRMSRRARKGLERDGYTVQRDRHGRITATRSHSYR